MPQLPRGLDGCSYGISQSLVVSRQAPGESHRSSRRARAVFRHSRPSRSLSCTQHKHRTLIQLVSTAVHWSRRHNVEILQQAIPGTSSCLLLASAPPSALRRRSGARRHMTSKPWPQCQCQCQECWRRSIHSWWWLHADNYSQPRRCHAISHWWYSPIFRPHTRSHTSVTHPASWAQGDVPAWILRRQKSQFPSDGAQNCGQQHKHVDGDVMPWTPVTRGLTRSLERKWWQDLGWCADEGHTNHGRQWL